MATYQTEQFPIDTKEMAKLRRWRSEFQLDLGASKKWQKEKRKWEQFYDGDQLTDAEKKELKARNQPEVVINLVKPRIDGVIGDFLGRRVMMRAIDKGTADFDKAKFVTDESALVEASKRVKSLLDRYPVYPELDLEFLKQQFLA